MTDLGDHLGNDSIGLMGELTWDKSNKYFSFNYLKKIKV